MSPKIDAGSLWRAIACVSVGEEDTSTASWSLRFMEPRVMLAEATVLLNSMSPWADDPPKQAAVDRETRAEC